MYPLLIASDLVWLSPYRLSKNSAYLVKFQKIEVR
jgi:hypothetical protein